MPGETPPKHTQSSPLIPRDTGSKVSERNAIMDGGYTGSALCGRHGVWIRFAVASVPVPVHLRLLLGEGHGYRRK